VGIVIERKRLPGETDYLRWYCDSCSAVVYEESFFCTDLGSQLKVVFLRAFLIEAPYASVMCSL
jgi:3-hydroxyanthranilate 3,4-dioxygenase